MVALSIATESAAVFISANSLASALILLKTFRGASTPKTALYHLSNDTCSRIRSLIFQLIDTTVFILLVFIIIIFLFVAH